MLDGTVITEFTLLTHCLVNFKPLPFRKAVHVIYLSKNPAWVSPDLCSVGGGLCGVMGYGGGVVWCGGNCGDVRKL